MSTSATKVARELGLKLIDAKAPLTIVLEAKDVKKGNPKKPDSCAFAVAAKRQLPGVKKAFFYNTTTHLQTETQMIRFKNPSSMEKEIAVFDRGGAMAPGTYMLVPPSKSITRVAIKARGIKRPGRHQPGDTDIRRKPRHSTVNVRTFGA